MYGKIDQDEDHLMINKVPKRNDNVFNHYVSKWNNIVHPINHIFECYIPKWNNIIYPIKVWYHLKFIQQILILTIYSNRNNNLPNKVYLNEVLWPLPNKY